MHCPHTDRTDVQAPSWVRAEGVRSLRKLPFTVLVILPDIIIKPFSGNILHHISNTLIILHCAN